MAERRCGAGMDKDFQEIEAKAADNRKLQERDDLHNESKGVDVGRITRHGKSNTLRQEKIRKERDKRALDAAILLANSFNQLVVKVGNKIAETQSVIYDAINQTIVDLDAAEADLKAELATASYLTDGTKVFLDDDGAVYRLDRQKVAQEDLDSITWIAGSMSWKEIINKVDNISHLHGRYDKLSGLDTQMAEIQERYDEIKNDQSVENLAELKLIEAKTEALLNEALNLDSQKNDFEADKPQDIHSLNLIPMSP